jgi:hypothetical protein
MPGLSGFKASRGNGELPLLRRAKDLVYVSCAVLEIAKMSVDVGVVPNVAPPPARAHRQAVPI